MQTFQEAFFDPHNPDHEEAVIEGLWLDNEWPSFDGPAADEMAQDYVETGISNLKRWNAEVAQIRVIGHAVSMAAWYELKHARTEINFVATGINFRGNGYGEAVMAATEARIRSRGFSAVELSSVPRARDFYLKIGYQILPVPRTGLIRMIKAL